MKLPKQKEIAGKLAAIEENSAIKRKPCSSVLSFLLPIDSCCVPLLPAISVFCYAERSADACDTNNG